MRAATSVWLRPRSRRRATSSPSRRRRPAPISRKPGNTLETGAATSSLSAPDTRSPPEAIPNTVSHRRDDRLGPSRRSWDSAPAGALTPPVRSAPAGALLQFLDALGGLGLRQVTVDLLARLAAQRLEVRLLRAGHRLVARHPVLGVFLGGALVTVVVCHARLAIRTDVRQTRSTLNHRWHPAGGVTARPARRRAGGGTRQRRNAAGPGRRTLPVWGAAGPGDRRPWGANVDIEEQRRAMVGPTSCLVEFLLRGAGCGGGAGCRKPGCAGTGCPGTGCAGTGCPGDRLRGNRLRGDRLDGRHVQREGRTEGRPGLVGPGEGRNQGHVPLTGGEQVAERRLDHQVGAGGVVVLTAGARRRRRRARPGPQGHVVRLAVDHDPCPPEARVVVDGEANDV